MERFVYNVTPERLDQLRNTLGSHNAQMTSNLDVEVLEQLVREGYHRQGSLMNAIYEDLTKFLPLAAARDVWLILHPEANTSAGTWSFWSPLIIICLAIVVLALLAYNLCIRRKLGKSPSGLSYLISVTPSNPHTILLEMAMWALNVRGTLIEGETIPLSSCVEPNMLANVPYTPLPVHSWRGESESSVSNMDGVNNHVKLWLRGIPNIVVLSVPGLKILAVRTRKVRLTGKTDLLVVDGEIANDILGGHWQEILARRQPITAEIVGRITRALLTTYECKTTQRLQRSGETWEMQKQCVCQALGMSQLTKAADFVTFCGDGNPSSTYAVRIQKQRWLPGSKLQLIASEAATGEDMQRFMVAMVRRRQQEVHSSYVWRQSDMSGTAQQVSVTSSSRHPRVPPSAQNLRQRQQAHALLASAAPATAVGRRGTRAAFARHVELAADPFLDDYHEATEMNQGIQAAVTANLQQLGLLDEGAAVEVDAMAFGRELVLALCAAKQRGELDMPVDQATAQSAVEESAGAAVVQDAASAPASPLAAVQCGAATSVPATVGRNDPATVPAQS